MIIYGASGHAKVVSSIVHDKISAFIDDDTSKTSFLNKPVVTYSPGLFPTETCIIAIGDNKMRKKLAGIINHPFDNVVADSVILASDVQIGIGNQLLHGSIIQTGSRLGNHVIINTGASVDHDCSLEDFVHIAPNCTLCGNVTIGEGTIVGAGSVVIPGIKIGKWCTIGAGSVVISDIPDGATVVGNPSRIIKLNE